MKRRYINRICPICKENKVVRKDSAGKLCRSCRAKSNIRKKTKDITNQKFGRLIAKEPIIKNRSAYWRCQCDCGNECIVHGNKLRKGRTKSCGCITKTKKGFTTSPTYRSWAAMIQRCYDKKVPHYKRYGGKGIIVCERWKSSFFNFLEDMGIRPKNQTLDRIDGTKNYEPLNCKWSSNEEQGANRKNNNFLTIFDERKTLSQWAKEYKINWSTLRKRIFELNWEKEKALTIKTRKKRKKKCH